MRRKYTDEVFEYAQKLREEGLSIKEISEITNIGMPVLSKNTVPNEKSKAAQKRIKNGATRNKKKQTNQISRKQQ